MALAEILKPSSRGRPAQKSTTNDETPMTPYNRMVVESHSIPFWRNILAAVFNWVLLAGFVVFPGTFTSLSRSGVLRDSQPGRLLLHAIRNTPLLCIACICCAVGAIGIGWLWWATKSNYVWLISRLFLPGVLHTLTALVVTLVNVYTAQDGQWSVTAVASISIIGSCGVAMTAALSLYQLYLVPKVQQMSSFRVL